MTDLAAENNNHGIANDGHATGADFTGSNQASLSAQALTQAHIAPGQTFTIGGASFKIPVTAPNAADNITAANQTIQIDHPAQGASHVYLLVASTGGATPANSFNYVTTINDSNSGSTDHQMPAIPDWLTNQTQPVTAPSGVTVSRAADLDHYDTGANATPNAADVYLYLISIPVDPNAAAVTGIVLPRAAKASETFTLHIFAETAS